MNLIKKVHDGLLPTLVSTPRIRTLLIMAVVVLHATAITATYLAIDASHDEHVAAIEAETRTLARLADQSITKSAAAFDLELKTIRYQLESSLRETGRLDPLKFNALLADQERNLQHSAGIRVSDASGRVILGTDVTPDSRATWGDRDFFVHHRDSPTETMTVTDPIFGRVSQIWVVSFARRYNNPDGSFAGVISVAIPITYFRSLLSSFSTGQHGVAVIRDSQSRLVVRYPDSDNPNVQLGTLAHSNELRAAIASGEDEVTYHTQASADGRERTLTYRRMRAVPFHLVMGMSPDDYLADWHTEARYTLFGLGVFLLVTTAFTWMLWRSICNLKIETERSHTLLTNASDGIHILDEDGYLIEASESFCAMLGFTRAELLGKHVNFWDAHYPPEALQDIVKDHFRATERLEFQTQHRHRDGRLIPVEVSGSSLKLNDQPVMFYSSRDITEKLNDRAELLASENRFRTLFDSSPDALWILREGSFIECNRAAVTMMGYEDKQALLGVHPADLSPAVQPDGEPSFAKAQRLIARADAGEPVRFDWTHVRRDGTPFVADIALSRISLHGQDVIYAQSRDVTEQKAAAAELERYRSSLESVIADRTQELAKQRNHLEIILNNIPSAVGYWDSHHINRFSNLHYRRWLEVSLKDIQDRHVTQVLRPDFLDRVLPKAEAALKGKAQHFMVRIPTEEGEVRHAEARYIPDRVDGKVVGFFVLAVDVTELKLAMDRAEAASRAKSVFLANMSHELRTPMNGVLGMIGIARKRMQDPDGLEKLDKAKRSAERLLAVLNDILDLSKIEADHLSLESIGFTPQTLLTQVNEMLGHQAASAGSPLRFGADDSVRQMPLLGDPLRLGQILINLVGNAIKFGAGRPIDIRVSTTGAGPETVGLRIEVEDHGIGISTDDQHRLFNAFEQADGSTTRKYGGTGLGLAICSRLIDLMGGRIGVDSTPDEGSCFWVELSLPPDPSAPPDGRPSERSDEAPEDGIRARHAGARVLIAEDEPFNQEIAQTLLDEVGLVAETVDNGEQALAMARAGHYDLILMDMQMPVLNGVEATRAIRADSLCMDTPIVAMTANAFDSDREACLAAGMNDHLPKPIDPDQFFHAVLTWLNQSAEATADSQ